MLEAYGRPYIVWFQAVAVTTIVDFLALRPADDKPCLLTEAHITQSTDYKDAEEEGLRIAIRRGYTAAGSGGNTTPTIEKRNPSDAAASFDADTNNTTVENTGTVAELHSRSFNNRIGWHFEPTPEKYLPVTQAQTSLVVRLLAAPADSITFDGEFHILELF
jgi:hypothetical protein